MLIHLTEMSLHPEECLSEADRLCEVAAESDMAHLMHMPAHIYCLVGQWDNAVRANQAACVADAHIVRPVSCIRVLVLMS